MRTMSSVSAAARSINCLLMCAVGLPGLGCSSEVRTCDPNAPACAQGQECALIVTGESRCVAPVILRGTVFALDDETPIAGALVQAVDANGAPVGATAVTTSDGAYALAVPAVRDADGGPIEGTYTLRVQAAEYQEFPTAMRPALPIDVASAVSRDDGWVMESALTTVGLVRIAGDTSRLGSIRGTVRAELRAGALIVASDGEDAFTGFSDSHGEYVIFNVSPGSYAVQGYLAGVQLESTVAAVDVGQGVTGVDLRELARPLNSVSGNVQIVNAPGGSQTSVVLCVESTFDEQTARGKVPPGLRVGNVSGAFSIGNVPDGRYVVLAAFENDDLVRDPDQSIGGTDIVRIELPDAASGNDVTLSTGFKVTAALAVIHPGAAGPEQVDTPTPLFEWEDDSSEDGYELRVFDAFGSLLWEDEVGPTTGPATVTHQYAGPALEDGMFYQFRVTSFRQRSGVRTAISATEDLKGVFYYLEPEAAASDTKPRSQ